jgi:hypothetical protein
MVSFHEGLLLNGRRVEQGYSGLHEEVLSDLLSQSEKHIKMTYEPAYHLPDDYGR